MCKQSRSTKEVRVYEEEKDRQYTADACQWSLRRLFLPMAVTSQAASYDPSPSWILIGNHDGIKKSRPGMVNDRWCALLGKRTVRHISVW